MSDIQASKGAESKLPVDYWSLMNSNPGYKILKKIGYDGVSGLGRKEQGEVRALCGVKERIGIAKGTIKLVSDDVEFEPDRKIVGMFVAGYYVCYGYYGYYAKKYEIFDLEEESYRYINCIAKIDDATADKRCYRITKYDYGTTDSNCGGNEKHYYAVVLNEALSAIEDYKINGSLASQLNKLFLASYLKRF